MRGAMIRLAVYGALSFVGALLAAYGVAALAGQVLEALQENI